MDVNYELLEEAKQFAQKVSAQAEDNQLRTLAQSIIRICQAIENVETIQREEAMHDQEAAVNRVKLAAEARAVEE